MSAPGRVPPGRTPQSPLQLPYKLLLWREKETKAGNAHTATGSAFLEAKEQQSKEDIKGMWQHKNLGVF